MRRMRQRRRNGIKVLTIEVANAERTLDAWIELGLLSETQRNDPKSISVALAVLASVCLTFFGWGPELSV
jgi:hypothetical protein